jgi:hypothetical protein
MAPDNYIVHLTKLIHQIVLLAYAISDTVNYIEF